MFNGIPQRLETHCQSGKQAAGFAAAQLVKDGMVVGIGTGSTAHFFIEELGERCKNGLKITAAATSQESRKKAIEIGISVVEISVISTFDLTVDGADEIDFQKRMIKGGGGALLREKIIASSSHEMVVIVDESKLVQKLGKFPLSVEIAQFGHGLTLDKLKKKGYPVKLRLSEGSPFITDNGNYIVDIHFDKLLENPERDEQTIRDIPGVLETGFFFNLAGRVVVGHANGQVEIYP